MMNAFALDDSLRFPGRIKRLVNVAHRAARKAALWCAAGLLLSTAATAQTAPQVKFSTSAGDFVVEVYPDKAPKTVENFLQ